MKKTYHGSCHCGSVRFSCDYDLAPAGQRSDPGRPGVWWTATFRCDCSFCRKTRFWKGFVPAGEFTLLEGRDSLGDYRFAEGEIAHTFCRTCGVYPFVVSSLPQLGGDFYCVNLGCLDDATPEELAAAPVIYEDGANDAWSRAPAVASYL